MSEKSRVSAYDKFFFLLPFLFFFDQDKHYIRIAGLLGSISRYLLTYTINSYYLPRAYPCFHPYCNSR